MTRPVNIYSLSRIHEEAPFNVVSALLSGNDNGHDTKSHEMESLRFLADALRQAGVSVREMDGFFLGFVVPRIGKEFDLLRFTPDVCLNIELKSTPIEEKKIKRQLLRNRHYLKHLGREERLYTVVTSDMTCYHLTEEDRLIRIPLDEIVAAVRGTAPGFESEIDDKCKVSRYLVSPITTPERFIEGEYFLTQAQESIKREVLAGCKKVGSGRFFHITGKPGTGKTLLLYDLARTFAEKGETLIVHCGALTKAHEYLSEQVEKLTIVAAGELLRVGGSSADGGAISAMVSSDSAASGGLAADGDSDASVTSPEAYSAICVDEAHRLSSEEFSLICEAVKGSGKVCVFSSDPGQVLSTAERARRIVPAIRQLPQVAEFVLSEKIRANRELQAFIARLFDLKEKPKNRMHYECVELAFANTTAEAQELIDYYREKEYLFFNFSKIQVKDSPYAVFAGDYDASAMIGQEFDKVVLLMDDAFRYDEEGVLQAAPHPNPEYLYRQLFYQGVTRVREELAIVVLKDEELFGRIVSIVE